MYADEMIWLVLAIGLVAVGMLYWKGIDWIAPKLLPPETDETSRQVDESETPAPYKTEPESMKRFRDRWGLGE